MFSSASEVVTYLKDLGFKKFKESRGNFVYILVPDSERSKTISFLLENIPKSIHNKSCKGSSLGAVEIDQYKIQVKPLELQGNQSLGISNELKLLDIVQICLNSYKRFDVNFISEKCNLLLENISKIEHVGRSNLKNNRADIIFSSTDISYPISIKQDNSERWCKVENHYGEEARKVLEKCIKKGVVKLEKNDFYYKLDQEIAIKMDTADKKFCMFGNDNAKIIKRTFMSQDIKYDGNTKTLNIASSYIFRNLKDLDVDHEPYFLLCNNMTRDSKAIGYRGLSLEAVPAKRILNKNNVVIID